MSKLASLGIMGYVSVALTSTPRTIMTCTPFLWEGSRAWLLVGLAFVLLLESRLLFFLMLSCLFYSISVCSCVRRIQEASRAQLPPPDIFSRSNCGFERSKQTCLCPPME